MTIPMFTNIDFNGQPLSDTAVLHSVLRSIWQGGDTAEKAVVSSVYEEAEKAVNAQLDGSLLPDEGYNWTWSEL